EGDHPLMQTLSVTDEQNQHYAIPLQRLPGHLRLDTSPSVEADIYLNGTPAGRTPTVLTGLVHGNYSLMLVAERYLPYETEITIEGLDQEQSLTAELTRAWGDVSLVSNPP